MTKKLHTFTHFFLRITHFLHTFLSVNSCKSISYLKFTHFYTVPLYICEKSYTVIKDNIIFTFYLYIIYIYINIFDECVKVCKFTQC